MGAVPVFGNPYQHLGGLVRKHLCLSTQDQSKQQKECAHWTLSYPIYQSAQREALPENEEPGTKN